MVSWTDLTKGFIIYYMDLTKGFIIYYMDLTKGFVMYYMDLTKGFVIYYMSRVLKCTAVYDLSLIVLRGPCVFLLKSMQIFPVCSNLFV